MPFRSIVASLAVVMMCGTSAFAQPMPKDFPNKPIRVVVPSPPGGPPDLLIRMLLPKLGSALGQPVVPDNRPGAGGAVGTAYVSRAAPDGYTWLFTTASHTAIPAFNKNVGYDPVKDFTPVTLAAQNFGQMLIVNNKVPAKNLQELIALAKKEPGKLTYGSAGTGTASHIPAELMKSVTGVDILGVPYKGVAEAVTDVLGGHIDMFFVGTQIGAQLVAKGQVRALAVTGLKRWKGMPDLPTMDEQGLKGFNVINWFGLWLPAGASPELIARLNAETVKALKDPDLAAEFDKLGLEPVGLAPDDFARFVVRDSAFTQDIARKLEVAEQASGKPATKE